MAGREGLIESFPFDHFKRLAHESRMGQLLKLANPLSAGRTLAGFSVPLPGEQPRRRQARQKMVLIRHLCDAKPVPLSSFV